MNMMPPPPPPLCIYHANCADGFTAAWVVNQMFKGDVVFHAARYGDSPPDVSDQHVIIVDFSYKRPVLEEMARVAKSILILDHHETAAKELEGLPRAEPHFGCYPPLGVAALFDMNRSGAALAWDYFGASGVSERASSAHRPLLVDYVQDRDLWRHELAFSHEVNAFISSLPFEFSQWDLLDGLMHPRAGGAMHPHETIVDRGEAIMQKQRKDVSELIAAAEREMKIGGVMVPVANLPFSMASDGGNMMAMFAPFAATYMDTPRGRVFSLRSAPDGSNVAKIAAAYGGGGHAHAAGFTVPLGWEGDEV